MDPLDRVKYIIAAWQNFIARFRSYKWHGLINSCVKDYYFKVLDSDYLKGLVPPVFAEYDGSLYFQKGWARVRFRRLAQSLLVRSGSNVIFRTRASREPYDYVIMETVGSVLSGSMSLSGNLILLDVSGYNPSCPKINWVQWLSSVSSPVGSVHLDWERWAYYRLPRWRDVWSWRLAPSVISFSYVLNWSFNSSTGKFVVWDNMGNLNSSYGSSYFFIAAQGRYNSYQGSYPGYMASYAGIVLTGLKFYSAPFS